MVTLTSWAGLRALAINFTGSLSYKITSIFSPFNWLRTLLILFPFSPMTAPTGSTLSYSEYTAILLLTPASLATEYNITVPSLSSGISFSRSLLTKP